MNISQINGNPIYDKDAHTQLSNKVDKVTGKGLSTNDYTDTDKSLVHSALQAHQDISGKADKTELPTKTSDLTNDSGYITLEDVPNDAVTSVNGKTGTVVLNASDVGAVTFMLQDFTTPLSTDDVGDEIIPQFEIEGNSTQDGTPTSTTPIDIENTGDTLKLTSCGKNLLPTTDYTETKNGVTVAFDSESNTCTLNGTVTSTGELYLLPRTTIINGFDAEHTYTLSIQQLSGSAVLGDGTGITYAYAIFNSDKNKYLRGDTTLNTFSNYTATGSGFLSPSGYRIALQCWRVGTVFTNYKIQVRLALGTTATSNEPYSASTYTIPLTDTDGTTHTMRKYDVVKKHDDGKWYFEQNTGYIASYDGESVTMIMSSTGELSTGAQVLYRLTETVGYELNATAQTVLNSIAIQKGNANIYFTNETPPTMTGKYRLDTKIYIDQNDLAKQSFQILGYYTSASALTAAQTTPIAGDAYGVGTANPYDIYVWDGINNIWVNNGQIQGPQGQKGDKGDTGATGSAGKDGIDESAVDSKILVALNNLRMEYDSDTSILSLKYGSTVINQVVIAQTVINGSIDEENTINLESLETGTYTLKYEDGTNTPLEDWSSIGTVEVTE